MQHSPQQPGNTVPSIPGYRLLEKLPHGHSADLYLAQQNNFNRQVVVKIASSADPSAPPTDAAPDLRAANLRIVREAHIAARMNNQHIVRIFDVGEYSGQSYLAMEYLEGGDLKRRLQVDMTIARALTVVKHIASALDYVHRQGYVHGNLSPDHILLDQYDKAILSNFSHASAIGGEQPEQTGPTLRSGAPQYLSPEQIRGRALDGRTDFYRLGVVLYEMLMGAPPFEHPEVTSLSMMILNAPVPRVTEPLAPLQRLVDGLLSKDISARYASGRELITDIEKLQGTVANQQVQRKRQRPAMPADSVSNVAHPLRPSTPTENSDDRRRPPTPRKRTQRRWLAIAIASSVLLGASYYLYSGGHLQQWADHGAASPNPQARILARQIQALLHDETKDADARFAATPSAQEQQALNIATANISTALGSQLAPGRIDSAMIATGAALALSDIEATH